jgi:pyruvate dehydrogenase E2 component (dihydrolipoamide acetyltransferase)/2-oxoisovalerate dehydrogenase E2 component (dihydrolipoyl transacylase)
MDFRLPELGEGVYEAEFVSWLVKPGDAVKSGQNLCEVMTDKATMEVPSPFAGTVDELRMKPGERVKVGDVALTYSAAGSASATEAAPVVKSEPARQTVSTNGSRAGLASAPKSSSVRAAPSVRLLARKLGVDLNRVRGSGPGGRILVDDLSSQIQAPLPTREKQPAAAQDFGRPGTRIKLAGMRRLIAEHMVRSTRTIPHYSYVDECDVTEMVRLREQLRGECARQGVKLTYLAFLVKALVAALKEVPLANASLDEEAEEIVLHDRYHIGIATATPAGLMVPVVHDADRKDLLTIAREIDRLSTAARLGKIRREEIKGGTFTLTSVGSIGGLISTPVINHPEVGILGVGKIVKRPVFDEHDQIRAAHLMYLSFSFDHRVVDGAVGAHFANAVLRRLEKPAAMLLPVG